MLHFFEQLHYLWLIIGLIVVAFAFFRYQKWRNAAASRINPALWQSVFTQKNNPKRYVYIFVAQITCLAAMVVALCNPQWGAATKKVLRNGVDIVFVVDASGSMMATDVQPNRLDLAKKIMRQAVSQLQNNRFGVVIYAGDAYPQLPLTSDLGAAQLLIDEITTQAPPTQGSYSSRAIELATDFFERQADNTKLKNRIIFLISDGEDLQGDAQTAAKNALEKNIFVHTIGIGTEQGSKLFTDSTRTEFKKNEAGELVLTKLNSRLLAQVATSGGGSYLHATDVGQAQSFIQNNLQSLQKKAYEATISTATNPKFQVFLAVAMLILVLICVV